MKYERVKEHNKYGKLYRHYFMDETGNKRGEHRYYQKNGQLGWHSFSRSGYRYGEVKAFDDTGTVYHHYLMDGKCDEIATVIESGKVSTHTEEQLIEIAKEHNLPLLSELPKTEEEVTLWNLKWPDMPCLPIEYK